MGSSTASTGNETPRPKSQFRFRQRMRRSVGSSLFGSSLKESGLNFVPHHGHSSNGIGDGLRSSFRYSMVRARADSRSLSPFRPIRFGVAARPTQRPISK